ncbi:MAG: FAD-dependent oxidoreductase [Patescibacteria group bacterium]|jgi:ferredoxin-NADP reductase
MSETEFFKVKLIKKNKIAEEVGEFHFEKPAGYNYLAGQFVQFKIPGGDTAVLRSYSISNSPDKSDLEFCIKILPTGKGSVWLASLEVGSEVEISAAKGYFTQNLPGNKYYIATGVGLAPIMAMLESRKETAEKLRLLFGVREEKDVFWKDRLANLKKENKNFDYILTVSRPGESWNGEKGRVTEHLNVDLLSQYYICGNVQMVKDVRAYLLANGLNTKSIHMEIF